MDCLKLDQGEIADCRPSLVFEDGSYTIPELLDSHLLPVVAQYDSAHMPLPFHEFNFDLSQPLMLYKRRNIQKVAARSLYIHDDKYEEIGESLLIPEDYKGWFAVLQRVTGSTRADDSVPHFTDVEEVANSNTDRFLIGGTKKVSGLQIIDNSLMPLKHEQRYFLPGDVLTKEKVFYGETKKRSRLFRKPKYITEKFLMCRDESDRDVLLPFEQKGIFYQVSHKYGKAQKNVMQMSDIVARKLTPRIIKLVFGRFPITPCSFTGLMKAESSKIETSIIASTVINTKNILMEIPLSSNISFRVALTDNALRQNACYRSAISLCAERAITYMRNIKVCYNFTADDSEEETTYWDQKENNFSPTLKRVASIKCEPIERPHKPLKTFLSFQDDNLNDRTKNSHETLRRGFSADLNDSVTVRPARCASTGRMSFCLGNSYLTVPVFEPGFDLKRNSGNNNTFSEAIFTTRGGSRISYNGMFFEEEENNEGETPSLDSSNATIPPSMSSTRIDSYVNAVSPPPMSPASEFEDYIPVSACRGPNTQPPDSLPPPPPRSSSTSGVSSGTSSPSGVGTSSHRGSNESFEYAVPKIEDPQTILSNIQENNNNASATTNYTDSVKPKVRRPSTFNFSEGCLVKPTSVSTLPGCDVIENIRDHVVEDGSPVYENIKSLMEMVAHLESLETDMEVRDDITPRDTDSEQDNDVEDIAPECALQKQTATKNNTCNVIASPKVEKTCMANASNLLSLEDENMNCKAIESDFKLPVEIRHADETESDCVSFDKFDRKDDDTLCNDVDIFSDNTEPDLKNIDGHIADITSVSEVDIAEKSDQPSELNTVSNAILLPNYAENVDKSHPIHERDLVCTETDCSTENTLPGNCNRELDDISFSECNKNDVEADAKYNTEHTIERAVQEQYTYNEDNYLEYPADGETICNNNLEFDNILFGEQNTDTSVMPDINDLCPVTTETTTELVSEIDEHCMDIAIETKTEGSSNDEPNDSDVSGIDVSNNVKPSDTSNPWRVAANRMTLNEEIPEKTTFSPVTTRSHIETICKGLRELTVDDVSSRLNTIGIKDASIEKIREMGVDGMRFEEVLEGTLNIRDCLRGVNLVDQQKISMFIRGWRIDV
ncbi:uncharacterized protein LOC128213905 [Mya arenaria]|uniref:uncharacterized protein LOC128213905 n=1 Tax=Mya arenaria TaxID=6604 RepID=UPI0022E9654C|nr:uncharacterized protein LOC128213905 [Mya arenaria]